MERIASAFWKLSLAAFTLVFLYVYAYLGTKVGVDYNEYGKITSYISKEEFFYYGMLIFVLLNAMLMIIGKLFLKNKPQDSDWTLDFKQRIRAWIDSFSAIINIFLITVVLYVFLINDQEGFSVHKWGWVIYIGLSLIGLWTVYLFVLLLSRIKRIANS